MKKVVLLAFLFAVLGSSFLLGQEEIKPFSWELKKEKRSTPRGDGLFTSKTFDEVWAATLKALMQSKYRVVHSDKDSGSISADELQTKYPVPLEIIVEKRENDIGVIVNAISDRPLLTLTYNTICKNLYQKIAVNLYGEEVIQKKKKTEEVSAPVSPTPQPKTEKAKAKVVDTPFIRVKVNFCNIRNNPSLQANIVKKAPINSEYKILGIDGDWFEILLDDSTTGYINKSVCEQFNKLVKVEMSPEVTAKNPITPAVVVPVVSEEKTIKPPKIDSSEAVGSEKDFLLGLGGALAVPVGDWSSLYSIGFGLDLHALFRIVDRLYIGAYFGGYYFPGKWSFNYLRLQPMLELQYRYPLSEKFRIFGGLSLGLAIDIERYDTYSDTEAAFATDLFFGLRYGAFYFNPRFRFVSHNGDSYGSFDIPVGIIF